MPTALVDSDWEMGGWYCPQGVVLFGGGVVLSGGRYNIM